MVKMIPKTLNNPDKEEVPILVRIDLKMNNRKERERHFTWFFFFY